MHNRLTCSVLSVSPSAQSLPYLPLPAPVAHRRPARCPPAFAPARGSTPLHFAANAKRNALLVCQALLQAGADTKRIDGTGRVPYEHAELDDVRLLLGGPDPR